MTEADGNIAYLGRNDFQVKIRGFRIELGEIEARLAACPGVREAVVIAREDSPGDKRLVAYLCAHVDAELSVTQLRAQLSASLAGHMLPSAFVVMEALPLTSNGKLDRAALPAPQSRIASAALVAPRNATEARLCPIWSDLLQVDAIGVHENFFESGGHSLLLVKLHRELSAAYPDRLTIADYFKYPTIAGLAAYLDHKHDATPRAPAGMARAAARKSRQAVQAVQQASKLKRTH